MKRGSKFVGHFTKIIRQNKRAFKENKKTGSGTLRQRSKAKMSQFYPNIFKLSINFLVIFTCFATYKKFGLAFSVSLILTFDIRLRPG